MGRRMNAPVRGSHGYYPRARASSHVPRVRSWPEVEGEPRLLGFPVYKVGMTHIVKIEGYKLSPLYGQEVVKPITVLEAPPIFVAGVRVYGLNDYGALESISEIMLSNLPPHAYRLLKPAPRSDNGRTVEIVEKDGKEVVKLGDGVRKWVNRIEGRMGLIKEVRVLALTQPALTGIGKKKPELVEIKVGGSNIDEVFRYAVDLLGREVRLPGTETITKLLSEYGKELGEKRLKEIQEKLSSQVRSIYSGIFREGELVDVIGVTKGKGFQGVIKRFGVKIMPRWHKHRKGHRRIGSVGPATPGVMRTVPRPGQLGYHRRVEYNKRIVRIGVDLSSYGLGVVPEINPKSGFKHYGLVRNDYIAVEGSVMGPPKRLIMLRHPVRPGRPAKVEEEILYIRV